ncbi:hypothetical protein EV361DRAFT_887889 [Lentinula raphanica]|nr:hypothetical protein EV361DRAFT_887889 [Lentinula raphanica]
MFAIPMRMTCFMSVWSSILLLGRRWPSGYPVDVHYKITTALLNLSTMHSLCAISLIITLPFPFNHNWFPPSQLTSLLIIAKIHQVSVLLLYRFKPFFQPKDGGFLVLCAPLLHCSHYSLLISPLLI